VNAEANLGTADIKGSVGSEDAVRVRCLKESSGVAAAQSAALRFGSVNAEANLGTADIKGTVGLVDVVRVRWPM
jgi:hypothetical protein